MTSKDQGKSRKSFTFALCDEQGVSCPSCVQTFLRNEGPLFCSNIQLSTHASQVCTRFELDSPTYPVCVSAVEVRDAIGVLVSRMPPASAAMLQGAWGQIPPNHWITSSCTHSCAGLGQCSRLGNDKKMRHTEGAEFGCIKLGHRDVQAPTLSTEGRTLLTFSRDISRGVR